MTTIVHNLTGIKVQVRFYKLERKPCGWVLWFLDDKDCTHYVPVKAYSDPRIDWCRCPEWENFEACA